MLSVKPYKHHFHSAKTFNKFHKGTPLRSICIGGFDLKWNNAGRKLAHRKCTVVKASQGEENERRTFLSLEEAGLVEMSGLSTHERFLCRLTISSLNLLRVISEQEGFPIEELNAGRVTDWFVKDKLKREQNLDSAVLQWDDSGFQI